MTLIPIIKVNGIKNASYICSFQNQLTRDRDWRQYPMLVSRVGKRSDMEDYKLQDDRPKRAGDLMGYGPMIPRRNYRDWMTRLG